MRTVFNVLVMVCVRWIGVKPNLFGNAKYPNIAEAKIINGYGRLKKNIPTKAIAAIDE